MKKVLSDFQPAPNTQPITEHTAVDHTAVPAGAEAEPQISDPAANLLLPGCRLQHWNMGRRPLLKIVSHRQSDPGH